MTTGVFCPKHSEQELELISTINEWIYYCKQCDKRFNRLLISKPEE